MKLKDKPLLLASAIVLSLVGSTLSMITFLGASLFFKPAKQFIESITNIQNMQKVTPQYFLILGTLSVLSFIGVLKISKMKRSGFFFYLGAQVALFLVPVIVLGSQAISSTNTIFTLLFCGIYAAFYKSYN